MQAQIELLERALGKLEDLPCGDFILREEQKIIRIAHKRDVFCRQGAIETVQVEITPERRENRPLGNRERAGPIQQS